MRPGLLLLLAVAALVPSLAEGRQVSEWELSVKLHEKLHLKPSLQKYKGLIVNIVVCEVLKNPAVKTDFTKVFGVRKTTTAKPTTKATTPIPTVTAMPNATLLGAETTPDTTTQPTTPTTPSTTPTMALTDEEGSGSGMTMTMEDMLNQEENKFNEEQMMRDDNSNNGESNEEGMESSRKKRSNYWSLGYYGIFQLTDSHFCDSGYRWSRNICRTSCTDFTDDDITDDVDCFVNTCLWRYVLRKASYSCWVKWSHF